MKLKKLALSSAAAAALLFTACGGGEDTPATVTNTGAVSCVSAVTNYNDGANDHNFTETCTFTGRFETNLDMNASVLNKISGEVFIGGDNVRSATLTIAAGAVLFSSGADYLGISRGSTINANGTLAAPIIMTSAEDIAGTATAASRGQWGGLVIAGNAQINTGNEETFEFSDSGFTYGGQDDADSSGTLTYVIVKHSGFTFPGNGIEVQGISMGAVGSGTTLSYIQVYNSSDDGVEIWGGAPKFDHLVITGAADDSIDTDHGARPTFQYVYAEQNGTCDHILEADNDGSNYSSTPQSHPVISNFTFVSTDNDDAFKWKEGTAYSLYDGNITGMNTYTTIEFDTNETITNAVNDNSEVIGVDLWDNVTGQTAGLAADYGFTGLQSFIDNNISSSDINGTATTTAIDSSLKGPFDAVSQSNFMGAGLVDWRSGWALKPNGLVYP